MCTSVFVVSRVVVGGRALTLVGWCWFRVHQLLLACSEFTAFAAMMASAREAAKRARDGLIAAVEQLDKFLDDESNTKEVGPMPQRVLQYHILCWCCCYTLIPHTLSQCHHLLT